MRKPAPVEHDVLDTVRERWSPSVFDREKPVEPEKLLTLLEAVRWAPSSNNEQPWAFILGDRDRAPETWRKMLDVLLPGNQAWAQYAPVLMLSLVRLHFARNGSVNATAMHDLGLGVGQMLLQATALGLHVHQMGGFDREKAREVFGIPDGYAPVAAIAIGYDAPSESIDDEKLRARNANPERVRKALKEFVFSGADSFAEPSPLVEPPA